MKASDAFALMLAMHDVRYCFELTGGMLTHLIDSLSEQGKVQVISMHHEQAASFAAEGVVRSHGAASLAVAMGTSGPGATNLITGISSCWFDSIPCLFVTGQVNRSEIKDNIGLRQQGFQELDIVAMVSSVTKYAVRVDDEMTLLPLMHQAMSEAKRGRYGPVLLDIPNDIQRMDLPNEHVQLWLNKPLCHFDLAVAGVASQLEQLKQLCQTSKRPLVCFGGGAAATQQMIPWLSALRGLAIPHVATLMGQKSIADHPCFFHMIGTYGNREANWGVQHCDVLIVLGARLDIRQTGHDTADFGRVATIVQIDIDPHQLNNRVVADLSIQCHLADFFACFKLSTDTFSQIEPAWLEDLQQQTKLANRDEYMDWTISPYRIMHGLNVAMRQTNCHYVCDVGNHQMWAAQLIRLNQEQWIHHDGGLGAMGFSLPVAIGVALQSQQKTIVLCGDGGVQLNIQELDTVHRLQLNMTIVVMNNQSLGMVKNFQDMYFEGRNYSTLLGYSAPTFSAVAAAYKIKSVQVHTHAEWDEVMQVLAAITEPFLIEVMMPHATECRPRLTFGHTLDAQVPHLNGDRL